MFQERKMIKFLLLLSLCFLFLAGCNTAQDARGVDKEGDTVTLEYQKGEELDTSANQVPILLNIGTKYCPSCAQIEPELEALFAEVKDKAVVRMVDLEKNPEFKERYLIEKIPTQIFIPVKGHGSIENLTSLGLTEVKDQDGKLSYLVHQGYLSKEQMKTILTELGMK